MLSKVKYCLWKIKDKIRHWLGGNSSEAMEDKLNYAITCKIGSFGILGAIVNTTLTYLTYNHIEEVPANSQKYDNYVFYDKHSLTGKKTTRPINSDLFIKDPEEFNEKFQQVSSYFKEWTKFKELIQTEIPRDTIKEVFYTIAMSLGIISDFTLSSQGARKNLGNRIEDLYSRMLDHMGVTYSNEIQPYGKSRIDIIISPYREVRSGPEEVNENELFCSVKFSSKDRMKTIFSDKADIEEACGYEIDVIGSFVHDVQRKGDYKVAKTFSTNIFRTKQKDTPLKGTYYIDKPDNSNNEDIDEQLDSFAQFFIDDIWEFIEEGKTND